MPETLSLRNSRTVDFLVTAIDNFGDVGFALDLGESLLFWRPEWRIRFFCDDRKVFDRLTAGKPHPRMEYRNLGEYRDVPPSSRAVSFFDLAPPKTDWHVEKLLRISYLRFDSGVASMNGTRYRTERGETVHLVPSPLEWGAGVVISPRSETPSRVAEESSVSVFCYPETLGKIDAVRKFSPVPFRVFAADIGYVRFDEYERLLPAFVGNVVRWENSAVKAMLSGKPFLWDFYKEKNGAHVEKIEDFLAFVRPFFENEEKFNAYADATRAFNSPSFENEDARKCAGIFETPDSIAEEEGPFKKMSRFLRDRDIALTVLPELEWPSVSTT